MGTHTRRPYAGPDILAVQIAERRVELAFLRTVWPQGPTQLAGVASGAIARPDDGALGEVGSQGVAQAPMADTGTAGTVEYEVQAGASDTTGCGMEASDGFDFFESTAALELGAHGMVTGSPGEAATGGNTGAHDGDTRACVPGDAAVGSGGGAGATVADEGASSAAGRGVEAEPHSGGACSAAHTDMADDGTVVDGNAGARATAVAGVVDEGAVAAGMHGTSAFSGDGATPDLVPVEGTGRRKRRIRHNRAEQDSRKCRCRTERLSAMQLDTPGPGPGPNAEDRGGT